MLKKFKIILLLASLSITLCLMSNTYSRYVASSTNNVDLAFAKWQILVSNNDITNNSSSQITINPTIIEDKNVADNKIAPSSKGYFDINIDPTNVDVSFDYSVNLTLNNENMPDLMITKYAVLSSSYKEGDAIEYLNINNGIINGTLNYNNSIEDFKFNAFTIRIYFEWYEGESENMNDVSDTEFSNSTTDSSETFSINANMNFKQAI